MTVPAFRSVIAEMLERFGHTIVTDPNTADFVTTKNGRKFVTACATPAEVIPTGTRDLARLHDAVIAAMPRGGYFITAQLHRAGRAIRRQRPATCPQITVNGPVSESSILDDAATPFFVNRRCGAALPVSSTPYPRRQALSLARARG
jgi:hypothetical protein